MLVCRCHAGNRRKETLGRQVKHKDLGRTRRCLYDNVSIFVFKARSVASRQFVARDGGIPLRHLHPVLPCRNGGKGYISTIIQMCGKKVGILPNG